MIKNRYTPLIVSQCETQMRNNKKDCWSKTAIFPKAAFPPAQLSQACHLSLLLCEWNTGLDFFAHHQSNMSLLGRPLQHWILSKGGFVILCDYVCWFCFGLSCLLKINWVSCCKISGCISARIKKKVCDSMQTVLTVESLHYPPETTSQIWRVRQGCQFLL